MYDVAVIGGGAAGLAACVAALRGGAQVCVLERLPRIGKKLLVTGNGRCNLSNLDVSAQSFSGGEEWQIAPVLENFGGAEDFFASLGLYTRTDNEGRIYPMSNTASSVLDALRLACDRAEIRCNFRATEIRKNGEVFYIESEKGETISAKRIVFSCGGASGKQYGTDASAFSMLKRLGHKIEAFSPALAPLKSDSKELRALKGIRVSAAVTARKAGRNVRRCIGEVQFNEKSLSGICVFDLSLLRPDELSIDLIPELKMDEVEQMLQNIADIRNDFPLEDLLTGLFNKRVGNCLLKRVTNLTLDSTVDRLDRRAISNLASVIKNFNFRVGEPEAERAQASSGGVSLNELTGELESKCAKGLYVAGEAIDVVGPCGGYNLHWAWASGVTAGRAAAGYMHD